MWCHVMNELVTVSTRRQLLLDAMSPSRPPVATTSAAMLSFDRRWSSVMGEMLYKYNYKPVSNVTAPPPLRPIRPKTRLRIGRASSLLLLLDLLCDFVVASVASHHYNLRPLTPHKHLCHGFV